MLQCLSLLFAVSAMILAYGMFVQSCRGKHRKYLAIAHIQDLAFVLEKTPKLADAIAQLAVLPKPPSGTGWLSPVIGAIEFQQHLIQVRLSI